MKKEFISTVKHSSDVIEFYHSYIWIEAGIICVKYKPDLVINIEIAKEIVADRKRISNSQLTPFLIDITELLSIDTQARKYLASTDACEFLSAGAIYTKNKLIAFIGTAWILLDKPLIPSKVFTDKEAAVEWLKLFKSQS